MVDDEAADICDELTRFSDAQATLLTSRGLVYLTDLKLDGGRHATIVAASHADAESVARARSGRAGHRPNGLWFPSRPAPQPAAKDPLVCVSDRIARRLAASDAALEIAWCG